MTVYVMNSPVATGTGTYRYTAITVDEARELLESTEFVSAIGHQPTAQVLSTLLGINIPSNRVAVKLNVGDKAVVFRLLQRLPEGKVLSTEEIMATGFEIGLWERIG